jgi:hypothetical protein
MALMEQTTPGPEQAGPQWRRAVRRRLNLSIHQHRSPASLFTLYYCECDGLECELKVALTDAEFEKVARDRGSSIGHPRCSTGSERGLLRRLRRRSS